MTLLLVTLLVAAGCTGNGAPAARHPVTLTLPEPTGKYPVGVVDLRLHDPDRSGPDSATGRDVMVSIWYPAVADADAPPAVWMPAPTASYPTTRHG